MHRYGGCSDYSACGSNGKRKRKRECYGVCEHGSSQRNRGRRHNAIHLCLEQRKYGYIHSCPFSGNIQCNSEG
jgi:hypothetical protein